MAEEESTGVARIFSGVRTILKIVWPPPPPPKKKKKIP